MKAYFTQSVTGAVCPYPYRLTFFLTLLFLISGVELNAQCDGSTVACLDASEIAPLTINENGHLVAGARRFVSGAGDCLNSQFKIIISCADRTSFHPGTPERTHRARINNACDCAGTNARVTILFDSDNNDSFETTICNNITVPVENRNAPVIMCENDTVFCTDPRAQLGSEADPPTAMETCQGPIMPVRYLGSWQELGDCDDEFSHTIIRSWRAEAKNGTTATCNDTTYVFNMNIESDSFFCPPTTDTIYCSDDIELDEFGNPLPDSTNVPMFGIPGFDTIPLFPGSATCKLNISYEDDPWILCPGTRIIKRTWRIKDIRCNRDTICLDTIVLIDTVGPDIVIDTTLAVDFFPEFEGSFLSDTLRSSSHDCAGQGILPAISITDDCSDLADLYVQISSETGDFYFNYNADDPPVLAVFDVPEGNHLVVVKANDGCWNVSMDTFVIVISDNARPISVCHDELNLPLSGGEVTWMNASSLDARSRDNCGVYRILGRRVDYLTACGFEDVDGEVRAHYDEYFEWLASDPGICDTTMIPYGFTDQVPFCCEDVTADPIMVEILVIDFWCNVSMCWGLVNVEDKSPPIVLEELPDDTITCTAYNTFYRELVEDGDPVAIAAAFGTYVLAEEERDTIFLADIRCSDMDTVTSSYLDGLLIDPCASVITEEITAPTTFCEGDAIKRVFIAEVSDHEGGTSLIRFDSQLIHIVTCPIDSMAISLEVTDTTIFSCGITYGPDGNVAIETPGPLLPFGAENDCQSLATGFVDKVFRAYNGENVCVKVVRTWCVIDWCELGDGDLPGGAAIFHTPGVRTFTQTIKVKDTLAPVITFPDPTTEFSSLSCQVNATIAADLTDDCGGTLRFMVLDSEDQLVVSGSGGTINLNAQPPGEYNVIIIAQDDCGNESREERSITLTSTVKPIVIAQTSITAELVPMDLDGDNEPDPDGGMVTIWAEEFNSSSAPPCPGDNNLIFLLERDSGLANPTVPPDSATFLKLTCEDLGTLPETGPVPLAVLFWVKDTVTGMADFVQVIIVLYNNMNACSETSRVAALDIGGMIATEEEERVNNVEVRTSESGTGRSTTNTGTDGEFLFNLVSGKRYNIEPYKDDDHGNGVSTIDLLKIQKHMLSIQEIQSPYKLIAADANKDGKINGVDMIQLRKLILQKIDRLPDNSSWRFVDKKYEFRQPLEAQQEDFPESVEVFDSRRQYDFVAVKIGDLNGNVAASRSRERGSPQSLVVEIPDRVLKAGEVVSVPVYLQQDISLEALQLALSTDLDKLSLVDIESEMMEISEENIRLTEQEIVLSWNGETTPVADKKLLTLYLRAVKDVQLSNSVILDTRSVTPEAMDSDDNEYGVVINFVSSIEEAAGVTLKQNYPNPFTEATTIEFVLPESSEARLTIYDVTGRILYTQLGEFAKGENRVDIQSDKLVPGILYYELNTSIGRFTKKMILSD